MAPGDVTAETFSSRRVCLARAREHLTNRSYSSARLTLQRGLRQWPDLEFHHEWLTTMGSVAFRQRCFREARRRLNLACRDEEAHVDAKFLLGRCLLEDGRFDQAVLTLDGILHDGDELVPYRVHAGGALSVAYAALGLNAKSQDALEVASEFNLVSAQLLADEGYRLMRIGAYPEAEVQLAKGLQVDSTCEDAFYRLCLVLFIQEKTEPAMEVLAYGIEQSPEFLPFYRLMSELYSTRGKYIEAAAFLKRSFEIVPRPDDGDLLRFMLAQALQRGGRVGAALTTYGDLLEEWPRTRLRPDVELRRAALENADDDAPAARLTPFPRKLQKRAYCAPNTLANVLSFLGAPTTQEEVAARVFRGAGTQWPEMFDYLEDVDGVAHRGFFGTIKALKACTDNEIPVITTEYHGMSGHALAVIGYDDGGQLIIAQDPRFLEPVEIPYRQLEKAWRHDDALCIAVAPADDADRLPEIDEHEQARVDEFVELLRKRGAGKPDETLRAAAALSDKSPDMQAPLRILAELTLERRRTEELKSLCEEALGKWPGCFWAHRHLGDAVWIEGDGEAALGHYRKALRIDRLDGSLLYALGELLITMGQRRRGRAFLVRALRENPRMTEARLRLAEDLMEEGRKDDAKFHARLLLEYEPDHASAKKLLDEDSRA